MISPGVKNDFLCGEIYISLNIDIDGLHPTFMYHLGVKRGPHHFSLGLALVELVKNACLTWPNNINVYFTVLSGLFTIGNTYFKIHIQIALGFLFPDTHPD